MFCGGFLLSVKSCRGRLYSQIRVRSLLFLFKSIETLEYSNLERCLGLSMSYAIYCDFSSRLASY